MEERTWLTILSTCDELDQLLRDAAPVADPGRVQRVQFLCAKLSGHDSYMSEKAGRIASRIAVYCSARRHQNEPRGADGLMHDMRHSWLATIREVAQQRLDALRRS